MKWEMSDVDFCRIHILHRFSTGGENFQNRHFGQLMFISISHAMHRLRLCKLSKQEQIFHVRQLSGKCCVSDMGMGPFRKCMCFLTDSALALQLLMKPLSATW